MNMGSIQLCYKTFDPLHHMFKFNPFSKTTLFSISQLKPTTFNLKVDIVYIMLKSQKNDEICDYSFLVTRSIFM
jgi:hypothetical protein